MNFSGWKNSKKLSIGRIKYKNPTEHIITEEIQYESRIWESNIIYPIGLQMRVKSNNFIENNESSPEILELTLDLLKRLYLSIQ